MDSILSALAKIEDMSMNKRLKNLSAGQKAGIAGISVAEIAAKISAWVDIYRRPAHQIRGPKWAWALAQLINGVGPAAYWTFGRK